MFYIGVLACFAGVIGMHHETQDKLEYHVKHASATEPFPVRGGRTINGDPARSVNAHPVRSVKQIAAAQVIENRAPRPPRTAILLVGQMRGFGEMKNASLQETPFDVDRVEDRITLELDNAGSFIESSFDMSLSQWLEYFLQGIVIPNNADVFIHSEAAPPELVKGLGPSLKRVTETGVIDNRATDAKKRICVRACHCQLYHLREAWQLMENYERENGLVYDVVVKTRSELAPVPPSYLDLAGWQTPKRIHMLTDMIFWGQRQDMAHMAGLFDALKTYVYYRKENPLPERPINVRALLDSLQRDRRTINKLFMLPYPDMGRNGAIANLKAASKSGMETAICDGRLCKISLVGCGNSCTHSAFSPERDTLDWPVSHGYTVCDLGSSAKQIYWSRTGSILTRIMERAHANDCGENEWIPPKRTPDLAPVQG